MFCITWTDVYSLLHAVKNLCFDVATIYTLVSIDIFEQFTTLMSKQKPLFGIFANMALRFIIPLVVITQKLYFFIFGWKIIHILDSKPLEQTFQNKNTAKLIFIFIVIFDFIRFIIFSHFVVLTIFVRSNLFWYNVLCCVCIHLLTIYQYLPCLMMHYFQFGILKYLKSVEINLQLYGNLYFVLIL